MIPNVTYGGDMGGLVQYLAGPGRANEHTEQHLIAGDPAIMAMHGESVLDREAARAIAKMLTRNRDMFDVDVTRQVKVFDPETGEQTGTERVKSDVWHCSLSLRAEEGQLTDEQWGRIATDFVDRMGFAGDSSGKADCQWIAVRHGVSKNGNDHIHIAVSTVREDGTKAHIPRDKKLSQTVARELEREYGLERLHEPERELGERAVQPAAREVAQRRGAVEVDSHRLERAVRSSAAASVDEAEFVRRMRQAGVLVRPRYAAGRDDVVAGYSVALRPEKGQPVVWHGGGKLARDLTLPEMRKQWPDCPETATEAVQEWRATAKNPWKYQPVNPGRETKEPAPELWSEYTRDIARLNEQLKGVSFADRATWAHAAKEASGAFAAWSQRIEATPGPLADAARSLARTAHLRAHESKARPVQRSSAAGNAMVLMQLAQSGKPGMAEALLMRELVKLSMSIYRMHKAAGDARRAHDVRSMMEQRMMRVSERMPAIPDAAKTTPAPQRESAATPNLSAEDRLLMQRRNSNRGYGEGSPIPSKVERTERIPVDDLPPLMPGRGRNDDRDR
ncbi:relaxase/mobilization nuclease domain-containing protein [Rathayibacter sp. VKM Ac-2754]|uniref:relaxase/mobilization nuclease domain-containing protein n=1 Tax=Rathayibacter sp. VKM Ac-2754 TaxID=2609251 RepID=UPI001359260C|nr:relaxase/mobilization nuclease domain-containing protein [Rathayibacter sp. VKM Ac-2754]MWV60834.1 relaxase/mobilization nuclease domain-containing protein [Rathayibacter sp. VKM Ac-2754]